MASKRVLLTGAGGFVGHHTLEHLLVTTDWEIVCTDSFRHKGKTDRLREVLESHSLLGSRVKVLTHDLRAPISPQLAHAMGPINYLISMASESHVDRSITDPRDFFENNVQTDTTPAMRWTGN
jgi:dTDP-glucose 4,6-dehydratase